MIGSTLGHYRIVEKLGHGGMGEVYLAEDGKLKRRVALKVLNVDSSADDAAIGRFQREAESVAALNHPNIVTLFSVEREGETRFLTMELVEGTTLEERIPKAGLPLEKFFEMAIPLADALSAAHEKGILHRDLKPANIMITAEGRLKVLDFGLAKLLHRPDSGSPGADAPTEALTQDGLVLGTIPYMAPEQVQGKPLDHRSDIFSMGAILFEMATGRRPFEGETSADLISAILRDTPAPVTELKVDLPRHLGRIIRHCLEKDPKRRYQSALDVRNELADLRREIDTGNEAAETAVLRRDGSRSRWLPAVAAVAIAALLSVVAWQLFQPESDETPVAAAAIARPSIAVLYFDNLSGDGDLEWLRSGLTDMLVTDLSQSPDLRVLSTDRLYQILSDMKKLDERVTSFEVVREVAAEAKADTVILGSFAKIGETIRISIKIQEAATGEILEADSVLADVQDDIFARVDDLSRNIRQSIALPATPVAVADRDLAEVSTDSLDAYRFYVEGEALHYQTKEPEAIELYKKAVELDPNFAMAWAKLSTSHSNVGREEEAIAYAERAIEHVDRLTEPERAYVEGRYHGRTLETHGRAIETYASTLEKYPHLTSLWNNLAVLYAGLWMHDDAIRAYREAVDRGDDFPGTFHGLAGAYAAIGEPARGFAVLEAFLDENPDSFSTYATYAGLLASVGRYDDADRAIDRAEELRPGYFQLHIARYISAILRDRWQEAEEHSARIGELPMPFARSLLLGLRINLLFYQGRGDEASAMVRPSIEAWPGPSLARARSQMGAAIGYYRFDSPEMALEHAAAARQEARGQNPDFVGHGIQVLANEKLGNTGRADTLLAELRTRIEPIPGTALRCWLDEVEGRLALLRGDLDGGIALLEVAAEALPAADVNGPRVLYALGEAYVEAGRLDEAAGAFGSIVEMKAARAFSGLDYVQSHYQLARVLEQTGDPERARELYARFVDYWRGGDLRRDWVDAAERSLESAGSA